MKKGFKRAVIEAVDGINHPIKDYGETILGFSRIFTDTFPYCIYFKKDDAKNIIVINAVLNEKQNRDDILLTR